MRVLISRPDRIGDVVLSLPVANSLKKYGHKVFYLVRNYTAPLLEEHRDVDGIVILRRNWRENLRNLKNLRFDAVLALYATPSLALLFKLSGIRERIGLSYRFYSPLFSKHIKLRRSKTSMHEYEINLLFLKPLGVKPSAEPPKLYLKEEEKFWAQSLLNRLKKPIVAINPISGGSAPDWTVENYSKLAKNLMELGISIVLTGQKRIKFEEKGSFLNLTGKTSLRELMAILWAVDIFISGSTGPAHIAASLGTPTISIFSRKYPFLPERWRPLHPLSRVVSSDNVDDIKISDVKRETLSLLEQL